MCCSIWGDEIEIAPAVHGLYRRMATPGAPADVIFRVPPTPKVRIFVNTKAACNGGALRLSAGDRARTGDFPRARRAGQSSYDSLSRCAPHCSGYPHGGRSDRGGNPADIESSRRGG